MVMVELFAKLLNVERLNNSVYGNPNYSVTLELGDGNTVIIRSSSNSAWCYAYDTSWLGETVSYTTTRSGRIDFMKLTDLNDVFVDEIMKMETEE